MAIIKLSAVMVMLSLLLLSQPNQARIVDSGLGPVDVPEHPLRIVVLTKALKHEPYYPALDDLVVPQYKLP